MLQTTTGLVPRAPPLAGPGQSPGLTSFPTGSPAGNGHEVSLRTRIRLLQIGSAAILVIA